MSLTFKTVSEEERPTAGAVFGMGADHSRIVKESVQIVPEPHDEKNKVILEAKRLRHADWAEVLTSSLAEWCNGHSCHFGFDHKIDYCIPQLKNSSDIFLQNIQPYCTRGYQFKIEKLQKAEEIHVGKRGRHRHGTNYKLPKLVHKRSRYVYPLFAPTVSIIGYQRKIAVLQVVYKKTKEVHFIAIELSTGKHLSVYKDIYISEPCIYEAYISPDESCYLIRPNFYFAYSRCSDPFTNFAITKDIKVLSIRTFESKVLNIIEDISALWHSIAFHPLSGCSRVALGNYTMEASGDIIAQFDIKEMKPVVQTTEVHSSMSHHLTYNPQGTLLVSLGIRMMSPRVDLMYPVKVLFFNSDDLTLVHVISRSSVSVNHFHASLTPLFSKTGDYMALIGNFGQTITMYKMPLDISLKHLCQQAILKMVPEENIPQLPLPKRLKDYLLFLPQWS